MESLTAASSSTTFRKRLSILGDKKQLAMLCLPFFSVFVFGVHAVRLSVPLLVVHKGEESQGTVYLLDETGRSDVIATTFKGISDFSTAIVEKFVPLPENTTLVETLPDLRAFLSAQTTTVRRLVQAAISFELPPLSVLTVHRSSWKR